MTDKTKYCRHYGGLSALRVNAGKCRAHVQVRELVGGDHIGWPQRMPCNQANQCETPCDKFSAFTPAEIEQDKADWDRFIKQTEVVLPVMVKLKQERQNGGPAAGTIECPICQGKCNWSIAPNNHMRMRCETPECLLVME